MRTIDMLKLIEGYAKKYKEAGIKASVIRNSHMNDLEGYASSMDDTLIDAVLVDFINFIAMNQGVDYGMYTKDLQAEEVVDSIVPKFDS